MQRQRQQECTSAQIFDTMRKLADLPMLRICIEDQISTGLPEGWTFYIDELGCGHFRGPLLTTGEIRDGTTGKKGL